MGTFLQKNHDILFQEWPGLFVRKFLTQTTLTLAGCVSMLDAHLKPVKKNFLDSGSGQEFTYNMEQGKQDSEKAYLPTLRLFD